MLYVVIAAVLAICAAALVVNLTRGIPDLFVTSNAARTCTAWTLTSSLSRDGLAPGRLDLGSSTAAGPSTFARLRSS